MPAHASTASISSQAALRHKQQLCCKREALAALKSKKLSENRTPWRHTAGNVSRCVPCRGEEHASLLSVWQAHSVALVRLKCLPFRVVLFARLSSGLCRT